MKKIHEGWRRFLKESEKKSDLEQIRLDVAKKMHDYLFAPPQITDPKMHIMLQSSGSLITELNWLYWALLGTKEERKMKIVGEPRWELAEFFAMQKVDLFLSQLTSEEEGALSADIDQLIKMVKSKKYPKQKIQIPLEFTGHPGVEASFGTVMINGTPAKDWGMGGSILTINGKSYLLHILEVLRDEVSGSKKAQKLEDKDLNELYFYGIRYEKPEPFKPHSNPHFRREEFADFDKFKKMMKSLRKK